MSSFSPSLPPFPSVLSLPSPIRAAQGTLQLTVKAPAVLALEPPAPLTPLVARWLAVLLAEPTVSPLWKLSVVQAAGSVCFFTPGQCLALLAGFDRDTQNAECVAAAQMLYARSAQPLSFWEHVLPRMTSMQQTSLKERCVRGWVGACG